MIKEVFQLGKPVKGSLFAGRKKIIDELRNALRSTKVTQHFTLIGYRRIGKSSIMQVVKEKLDKDPNTIVVYLDAQQIIPFNINEFLKVYSAEVLETYYLKKGNKALALKVKNFIKVGAGELKDIISGFHGQIKDFFVFWFEKAQKNSLSDLVKESLTLPELLSQKEKFVIMIDEFQEIDSLGPDFGKAFRANMQQMKNTSFLIAGSQVSLMRKLMYSQSSPLYNMFIVKYVEELDREAAAIFLKERFAKSGMKITSDAIQEIIKLTNSHPYHIQWLGRACLFKSQEKLITDETVRESFKWAIREEAGHLEYAYARLKGKSKAIITTSARIGPAEPIEIAKELHEESDNIRRLIINLVDEGYLIKEGSRYKIRDPVLGEYIQRKIA